MPDANVTGNESWLSPQEAARIAELAGLRQLFEGRHRQHFLEGGRTQHEFKAVGAINQKLLYITENLAGRCSMKFSDLLFGEELLVEPASDSPDVTAAIARLDESSDMHALLFEAASTASWAGKAYVQLLVRNSEVVAELIEPENVTPVYAVGTRRLVSATIKQPLTLGGKKYLRVIEHTVGQITHQLFSISDQGGLGPQVDLAIAEPGLAEVQPTGIDELTIVELQNYTAGGRGLSDYLGTESLQDEVNNRRSQVSRVLDIHGDPAVQALSSMFDGNGNLRISGRAVAVESLKDGDALKYVVWEAQLEWAIKALADAGIAFCGQMETAPALIGLGGATSADGVEKFKLQVAQTLARVKRKALFLSPGIKAVYRIAQKLEHTVGLWRYAILPLTLTFSDGLPVDQGALLKMVGQAHTDGVMSLKMALNWIHADAKVVAQELSDIDAETAAKLPTAFRAGKLEAALHEPGDMSMQD